jgi:hypothetical protein
VNEEPAQRKIINCINKAHAMNLGEYLVKVKNKRENKVGKMQ